MKGIKIAITCLLLVLFSALFCCTILSWDYLTSPNKQSTQIDLNASYEQGIADEKANSENTISDLISKHQAELLKLQQKYNDLNTQKNELENEVKNLETENSSQSLMISYLNTEIEKLNNQVIELKMEISKLNNIIYELRKKTKFTSIYIFDQYGHIVTNENYFVEDYYDRVDTLSYIIPSTLPNGTEINEWIIEYYSVDPLGNVFDNCEVVTSGTHISLASVRNIYLSAVAGEVYDVTFYGHDGFIYKSKASHGSLCDVLKYYEGMNDYFYDKHLCYSSNFIQEEFINGQWIEVANSNHFWFNTNITNITRFICKCREHDDTWGLPQVPNN